ncbi:MAG: peptidoglycan DL-endopeptidase CwlO, partial [Thermoleophilaceae bacterium]|nr:peptidoglycan DL-endopeptidase CwlO [Thermoleophilaceae bacterium]
RSAMRHLAIVFLILAATCSGTARAATLGSWDPAEQKAVQRAGVLPALPGGFHGEQGLTAAQLNQALAAVARRTGARPVVVSASAAVTVASFHRAVVKQLGLADLAKSVRQEAVRAGLEPPSRFGTEVVARQLGLRFDHPSQDDGLELYPTDAITRAEAAYSFARVLANPTGGPYYARSVLDRFTLPAYSDAQKRVLHLAVSKIGMPYVWGGESDTTSSRYGPQAHGGYDCSGFEWRVYKQSGDPAGAQIGGRTAAQMAGEIPKRERIAFGAVAPADLLFFGPPSNIGHVGIALSGDFMIQSSGQGVNVAPLFESWRRDDFAWARRVI